MLHRLNLETLDIELFLAQRDSYPSFIIEPKMHVLPDMLLRWRTCIPPPPLRAAPDYEFLMKAIN